MKKLPFYKKNNNWYALVPEHTEEDNMMIAGSDKLLEMLYPYRQDKDENKLTLFLSTGEMGATVLELTQVEHDMCGVTYQIIGGSLAKQLNILNRKCWICNVTHTVFGEHPKTIFVHSIY